MYYFTYNTLVYRYVHMKTYRLTLDTELTFDIRYISDRQDMLISTEMQRLGFIPITMFERTDMYWIDINTSYIKDSLFSIALDPSEESILSYSLQYVPESIKYTDLSCVVQDAIDYFKTTHEYTHFLKWRKNIIQTLSERKKLYSHAIQCPICNQYYAIENKHFHRHLEDGRVYNYDIAHLHGIPTNGQNVSFSNGIIFSTVWDVYNKRKYYSRKYNIEEYIRFFTKS